MRLYDNAPDSFHEELRSYFPTWYKDIREMDAIWDTAGAEFDLLKTAVNTVLDNAFIDTCEESIVVRIENFLGITYRPSRTLAERRKLIKSYYVGFGKVSATKIKSVIRELTDANSSIQFSKIPSSNDYGLFINIDLSSSWIISEDARDDLYDTIERIIPAHLYYELTLSQAIVQVDYEATSVLMSDHYVFKEVV